VDELDRDLLQLLTQDARASATDLAQRLQVARGTIQNRIDKFLRQGVIRRFTVELGNANEDYQVSAFSLIKLASGDGRPATKSIRKIHGVIDIHTLSGPFDMVAEIRTSSLGRLDQILDEIRRVPDVAETQSHIRLAKTS
jgi:DNA-binding Lrp family transcriptional regulator